MLLPVHLEHSLIALFFLPSSPPHPLFPSPSLSQLRFLGHFSPVSLYSCSLIWSFFSHLPHTLSSYVTKVKKGTRTIAVMRIRRLLSFLLVGLVSQSPPATAAADALSSAPSSLSYSTRSDLSKGFSLAVSRKADSERDFVRDWAAAHQKWGRGVPEQVSSTFFSLLDSG